MKLPRDLGPIHFIGIGGIGMSGIAEILLNLGYPVQGSDILENANIRRLRDKGAKIFIGHLPDQVLHAAVVVVSTAIKGDNVEFLMAREKRIPIVRRAEMLAELMRLRRCIAIAGTHGKTTTTSLIAAILDAASFDPTVINGGIINSYGTNARLGGSDWMVVEADESDGTFLKLPADITVVTNIDPEHLDHFKTFDAVKEAFRTFIENIPFYGFSIMCLDHPVVQELVGQIQDRRVITYGVNPQADVRLLDIDLKEGISRFTVLIRDSKRTYETCLENIRLSMPGHHNALNATAAIAVAYELGIGIESIREALANFGGVKRRFSKIGCVGGVTIFDDYAHHPVEIAAVLKAARASTDQNVIAVVQPHRYSRLQSLFNEFVTCFNDADSVIVSDVYGAGEGPLEDVDRDHLVAAIKAHGHRHVLPLPSPEALPSLIADLASPGDYVVCLGAGTITQWAQDLLIELQQRAL